MKLQLGLFRCCRTSSILWARSPGVGRVVCWTTLPISSSCGRPTSSNPGSPTRRITFGRRTSDAISPPFKRFSPSRRHSTPVIFPSIFPILFSYLLYVFVDLYRITCLWARRYSKHHHIERSAGERRSRSDTDDSQPPRWRGGALERAAGRLRRSQTAPAPHAGTVPSDWGALLDVRQESLRFQLLVRKRWRGSHRSRPL